MTAKLKTIFQAIFQAAAVTAVAAAALAGQTKTDTIYSGTSNAIFSFVDLVNAGGSPSVLANTDDGVALLTLPFPFQFYGKSYTMVCASSNGVLAFVTDMSSCTNSSDFANTDLSATAPPGDLPSLLPFWSDLMFQNGGAVYYSTQGTAGSRKFVVEWSNAYQSDGSNPATFEVILSEGSNEILFQYQTVDFGDSPASKGALASIGIRDSSGNSSNRQIAWSYNSSVIANSLALRFTPVRASYLVGDVYPFNGDIAGLFGDTTVNTLDLLDILRAVTNISTPARCSDRFDAMDAFPADGDSTRGGDGVLETLDLLTILRRATGVDSLRPMRAPLNQTCSTTTPQRRVNPGRVGSGDRSEATLSFGPAERVGEVSRTPVYLRAEVDLDLVGLSLGMGQERMERGGQLRFVPSDRPPSLSDQSFAGKIALAWLNGWQARAGQQVLLGYLEGTASPEALKFFGASGNFRSDGRSVRMTLPVSRR